MKRSEGLHYQSSLSKKRLNPDGLHSFVRRSARLNQSRCRGSDAVTRLRAHNNKSHQYLHQPIIINY